MAKKNNSKNTAVVETPINVTLDQVTPEHFEGAIVPEFASHEGGTFIGMRAEHTPSVEESDDSGVMAVIEADRQTEIATIIAQARQDMETISSEERASLKAYTVIKPELDKLVKLVAEMTGKKARAKKEGSDAPRAVKVARDYKISLENVERLFATTSPEGKATPGVIDVFVKGKVDRQFTVTDGVHPCKTWADAYWLASSLVREVKKLKGRNFLSGDYHGGIWTGVLIEGDVKLPVAIIGEPPAEKTQSDDDAQEEPQSTAPADESNESGAEVESSDEELVVTN